MVETGTMKIGDLARQAGCGVETIRYYEREGLLPVPARTASNYRQYNAAHLQRLRFIRRCRSLDMSQDEVRTLLGLQAQPSAACDGVNACVDEHIEHVERKISELQALRAELLALRGECAAIDAIEHCGILGALAAPTEVLAGTPVATHVNAVAAERCCARPDAS